MMSVDLSQSYKDAQNKLKAIKTFKNVSTDYKNLKQSTADNLEQAKSDITSQLNNIKNFKKRFQREVKTQFEQLLDLVSSNISEGKEQLADSSFGGSGGGGKGSSTIKYIKKTMVKALKKIEPDVVKILFQESLHAVGCSHEQSFPSNTKIYVRVQSIDIFGTLKLNPDEAVGASIFEPKPINVGTFPFSMNKELYNRVQKLNTDFYSEYGGIYIGKSGQQLFNIKYVQQDNNGVTGDFYEITLPPRFTNNVTSPTNKVGDFMKDYYGSIQVIDFNNIFSQLIESLTGAISISANIGREKLEDMDKFSLLIQRVLGLCFDNRQTIDVGGVAKIAELDGFDDSFFEFSEIDLRNVEQNVNNIKNGVVQFESCGEIKLPVNNTQLVNALNQITFVDKSGGSQSDLDNLADNLTNVITDNPEWALFFPTISDVKIEVDTNFIKNLPSAFIKALLSPKIILPIMIMLKAIQQLVGNAINQICNTEINSAQDFFKCFKSFMKNLISKIGALFVKELFEIIKKDIVNLIQSVIKDLNKEKIAKKYAIILKLTELIILVAQFIRDWRQCKSVIDEILALLQLATSGLNQVPLPLLAASRLCSGYSASKAMINVIEEMQSVGLPTGPMPDGSPNLMLTSMFSNLKGQDKENAENGKAEIFIQPLIVTPSFTTMVTRATGKSF